MIDRIDHAPLLTLVSGILLVFSSGCEDLTRPPPPTPPVVDSFPSVPESSTAYDRESPHTSGASSRYVLDTISGEFELQFLGSFGLAVHTGTYAREDSVIDFDFWGDRGATGILAGDSLHVRYDVAMLLSDFENGTYVRR